MPISQWNKHIQGTYKTINSFFLKISVKEQAELLSQAKKLSGLCMPNRDGEHSLRRVLTSVVLLKVSYLRYNFSLFQSYKGKGEILSKGTFRGKYWIRANLPQIHFFISTLCNIGYRDSWVKYLAKLLWTFYSRTIFVLIDYCMLNRISCTQIQVVKTGKFW